jgi:hypothetical protein
MIVDNLTNQPGKKKGALSPTGNVLQLTIVLNDRHVVLTSNNNSTILGCTNSCTFFCVEPNPIHNTTSIRSNLTLRLACDIK